MYCHLRRSGIVPYIAKHFPTSCLKQLWLWDNNTQVLSKSNNSFGHIPKIYQAIDIYTYCVLQHQLIVSCSAIPWPEKALHKMLSNNMENKQVKRTIKPFKRIGTSYPEEVKRKVVGERIWLSQPPSCRKLYGISRNAVNDWVMSIPYLP